MREREGKEGRGPGALSMYDSLMDAHLVAPTLFSKRIGEEGERGKENRIGEEGERGKEKEYGRAMGSQTCVLPAGRLV